MSAPEDSGLDGLALEDLTLPDEVEGFTKRRVELVQRAVKEWTAALIDLGGRNNLLHYRDLKAGTLDLSHAAPAAVAGLLQGKTIKTSTLFGDPDERERSIRRLRTISSKAKENFEERGLETLSLACGLATWNNEKVAAWEPSAPVLLRQASLRPLGAARDDFELVLVDEMEVNPTLLHFLKVNFDCDFDQETLNDRLDGVIDEPWELEETYRWVVERASRVPGLSVAPRLVLANFAYAKLPMVRDLEQSFDELVAHDLIAAIAGDEEAREAVRAAQPGPEAILSPDATPLADEFLILDADSSQNWAINAVLAGESLIIRGPPGTGKSQTISNLIASLIARNKRVLFVAEKRAAIDAVLKRVRGQNLGDLVLDLHGGVGSRQAFAQTIGVALAASRVAPRVDGEAERRRVEKRREELNTYARALHEPRAPWDVSLYQLRADLLGLREFSGDLRFDDEVLGWLTRDSLDELEEEMSEYARLGGFTLAASGRPWAHTKLTSVEQAHEAYELVDRLRRERVPKAAAALKQAATETGLPAVPTFDAWAPRLDVWREISTTLERWKPVLYEEDLDGLIVQMAPAGVGGFTRMKASLVSAGYKQAKKQLRAIANVSKLSDAELRAGAEAALQQRTRWSELGGTGTPLPPSDLAGITVLRDELLAEFRDLAELTTCADLAHLDEQGALEALAGFSSDRGTLMTLPELHRLRASFDEAGLGAFVSDLEGRQAGEDVVLSTLRCTWGQSILDRLALTDRLVDGFDPDQHQKTVRDFKTGDKTHIETTAGRIRRLCAEQAASARDRFPRQSEILQHQARLKRRHMPVRDLVRDTADVLLALKPCWAMSPLMVSQLLPAKTYFDVVIFDEASQVTPS